ncbi:hypothetical protein CBR_g27891 [Chara braunii]|uniref:Carbohydrate kinase PfkB domain-containing protein n=1 Tax=Chara braunii TaxID=69332 RepID=A0A388L8S0_CHABU|nr:hypothetical protein CBR_g27891 [Chara braunii]|eukprot:GBG78668.1 hypothetical protein CBR_g27891 [Chara braunii]
MDVYGAGNDGGVCHVDRIAGRVAVIARHVAPLDNPTSSLAENATQASSSCWARNAYFAETKQKPILSQLSMSLARSYTSDSHSDDVWLSKERTRSKDGLWTGPVVVGGMVLDIQSMPDQQHQIRRGTTAPGKVCFAHGGVARNIGECISLLGVTPFLISVVGDDPAGDTLVSYWESCGLSTRGILRVKGKSTPVVSALLDKGGEITAAVADISTVEKSLRPEWILQFEDVIKSAAIVILDGNLLPETLEAACDVARQYGVPIWFEPVSVAKAVRVASFLHKVDFVSPNEAELIAMSEVLTDLPVYPGKVSGLSCRPGGKGKNPLLEGGAAPKESKPHLLSRQQPGDEYQSLGKQQSEAEQVIADLDVHIQRLLLAGVQYVVLKIGPLGALLSYRAIVSGRNHIGKSNVKNAWQGVHATATVENVVMEKVHYPAIPAKVDTCSGGGDCLVAGTVAGLVRSLDIRAALAYGVAAAKWAIESPKNVPDKIPLQQWEGQYQ